MEKTDNARPCCVVGPGGTRDDVHIEAADRYSEDDAHGSGASQATRRLLPAGARALAPSHDGDCRLH